MRQLLTVRRRNVFNVRSDDFIFPFLCLFRFPFRPSRILSYIDALHASTPDSGSATGVRGATSPINGQKCKGTDCHD